MSKALEDIAFVFAYRVGSDQSPGYHRSTKSLFQLLISPERQYPCHDDHPHIPRFKHSSRPLRMKSKRSRVPERGQSGLKLRNCESYKPFPFLPFAAAIGRTLLLCCRTLDIVYLFVVAVGSKNKWLARPVV